MFSTVAGCRVSIILSFGLPKTLWAHQRVVGSRKSYGLAKQLWARKKQSRARTTLEDTPTHIYNQTTHATVSITTSHT